MSDYCDQVAMGEGRRGLATSFVRTSKVAVPAWMRISPEPEIASVRRAIARTPIGSSSAGVWASDPK